MQTSATIIKSNLGIMFSKLYAIDSLSMMYFCLSKHLNLLI